MSFDAKRDRWNGYDTTEHKKIYEEYEQVEEARRKLKESELDKQDAKAAAMAERMENNANEFGDSEDDDDDEEKYADKSDMPGQKVNAKTRTTIRNLRYVPLLQLVLSMAFALLLCISRMIESYGLTLEIQFPIIEFVRIAQSTCTIWILALPITIPRHVRCARILSRTRTPTISSTPETTSNGTLEASQIWRMYNCLPGRQPRRDPTCTCRRIQHRPRCCTKSSKRRRPSSRTRTRSASWPSTEARNIWTRLLASCCWPRRRIMSSTRGREGFSRVSSPPRSSRSTRKMFTSTTIRRCGARSGPMAGGATSAVDPLSKGLTVRAPLVLRHWKPATFSLHSCYLNTTTLFFSCSDNLVCLLIVTFSFILCQDVCTCAGKDMGMSKA